MYGYIHIYYMYIHISRVIPQGLCRDAHATGQGGYNQRLTWVNRTGNLGEEALCADLSRKSTPANPVCTSCNWGIQRGVYRQYLAHKKHQRPSDHHWSWGIGIMLIPTRGIFLMSQVPLYWNAEEIREGQSRAASDRKGSTSKYFEDCLRSVQARVCPQLSYACQISSTAESRD
jgi:hypothetical protein